MIPRRHLTPAQVLENFKKLNPEPSKATGKDYMSLVEARMKETGESKAMAMRAVTAKHPEAHRRWIEEVNRK